MQKEGPLMADTKDEKSESQDSEKNQDDDISLDEVQKILDSKQDPKELPKNMQRLLAREKENNSRVQKSIKGAKTNPKWFVPLFCTLLIVGLAWVVIYYATSMNGSTTYFPIPKIGDWNLLIGFLIMLAGFLMTMWWN
jgi:5'-3' exonuclease